jgi:hypothetical protein
LILYRGAIDQLTKKDQMIKTNKQKGKTAVHTKVHLAQERFAELNVYVYAHHHREVMYTILCGVVAAVV